MITDELLRSLCDRVVQSQGAEFEAALLELHQAIEARLDVEKHEEEGKSAKG